MINILEVTETNQMIEQENLDVRTITMGINLLDCADSDLNNCCKKIYNITAALRCQRNAAVVVICKCRAGRLKTLLISPHFLP